MSIGLDKNNMIEEEKEQDKDILFIMELSERLVKQKQITADRRWNKLHSLIEREKKWEKVFTFVFRAAAILLLPVLGLSGYLYMELYYLNNQPVKQLELKTAYGVVSKVELADGTEVLLNSGSRLIYPERFDKGKRQVYLSGEAYFKVESDPQNRFEVLTTDGVTVSAYGTEFNVRSYDEDDEIEATLTKGKVEIEQSEFDIMHDLEPGEQAIFSKHNKSIKMQKVNLFAETAWKDGKMIFRRTPMEEVAKKLSRHFNVDIVLQGKEIYDYAYSATFTTETLAEILSLLEKTAPIRCEILEPEQNDDLVFSRKKVIIHQI